MYKSAVLLAPASVLYGSLCAFLATHFPKQSLYVLSQVKGKEKPATPSQSPKSVHFDASVRSPVRGSSPSERMATTNADSITSGSFSKSVQDKVKEYTGSKCWLCRNPGVDVAHMFAKEDPSIASWSQYDMINFLLCSPLNAMALCPSCHRQFDTAIDPGLAPLPTDLQYFIDFEIKDAQKRKAVPGLRRTVPSSVDYKQHQISTGEVAGSDIGGLYSPIILRSGYPTGPAYLLEDEEERTQTLQSIEKAVKQPRTWHGSPIAALRRAMPLLSIVSASMALTTEQIDQLRKLYDLYFDPNYLKAQQAGDRPHDHPQNPSESSSDKKGPKPKDMRGRKRRREYQDPPLAEKPLLRPRNQPKQRKSTNTQKCQQKVWCPDFKLWVTPCWVFGPEMSSKEIMEAAYSYSQSANSV